MKAFKGTLINKKGNGINQNKNSQHISNFFKVDFGILVS